MSFNDVSRGGPSSHHEKKQTRGSCITPARKMKILGRQGVDYHAKIGYRLKKET